MNTSVNNINFSGRYLLKGKTDAVNRAANTIKTVKGDDVDFFHITCADNRLVIVATNEDVEPLQEKKKNPNLYSDIKNICADKKRILSNLFKYFFNTDSGALIVEGHHLAKFGLYSPDLNYDNGTYNSKYKSAEYYVDGSCRKYTLKGRLCELTTPEGKVIQIAQDGSKTIINPDGTQEFIPSKYYLQAKKQQEKMPVEEPEIKKPQVVESEKIIIAPPITRVQPQVVKFVQTALNEPEPIQTKPPVQAESAQVKTPVEVPTVPKSSMVISEVLDSKGRISQRIYDDGNIANYIYKERSDEVLFIYHSNGSFETDEGIVNYADKTISFPYKDGIMQVLNHEGRLIALVFPDGTKKLFDSQLCIMEKIFPDGKRELFNERGRMYLTIYPDGTKEYTRSNSANTVR